MIEARELAGQSAQESDPVRRPEPVREPEPAPEPERDPEPEYASALARSDYYASSAPPAAPPLPTRHPARPPARPAYTVDAPRRPLPSSWLFTETAPSTAPATDSPAPQVLSQAEAPVPAPATAAPGAPRPPLPPAAGKVSRSSSGRWRNRVVVVLLVALAGVLIAVLAARFMRTSDPVADERNNAVAAWQDGNKAWSRGNIDNVCDSYDAIGPGGMFVDRDACVRAEQAGFASSTMAQREDLSKMTVDADKVQVVASDVVVIWFKDAEVDGVKPPYFTDTDFVTMQQIPGLGWRQIGVRYGSDIVGTVPQEVVAANPPTRPTTSPTGGA